MNVYIFDNVESCDLLCYCTFIIIVISQCKSQYCSFASLGDNSGWIDGKQCSYTLEPEDSIFSTYSGDSPKDLETAKKDCAEACDNKSECKYANLYWTDKPNEDLVIVQYCFLSTNEQCDGGKKIVDCLPCNIYTKQ